MFVHDQKISVLSTQQLLSGDVSTISEQQIQCQSQPTCMPSLTSLTKLNKMPDMLDLTMLSTTSTLDPVASRAVLIQECLGHK